MEDSERNRDHNVVPYCRFSLRHYRKNSIKSSFDVDELPFLFNHFPLLIIIVENMEAIEQATTDIN